MSTASTENTTTVAAAVTSVKQEATANHQAVPTPPKILPAPPPLRPASGGMLRAPPPLRPMMRPPPLSAGPKAPPPLRPQLQNAQRMPTLARAPPALKRFATPTSATNTSIAGTNAEPTKKEDSKDSLQSLLRKPPTLTSSPVATGGTVHHLPGQRPSDVPRPPPMLQQQRPGGGPPPLRHQHAGSAPPRLSMGAPGAALASQQQYYHPPSSMQQLQQSQHHLGGPPRLTIPGGARPPPMVGHPGVVGHRPNPMQMPNLSGGHQMHHMPHMASVRSQLMRAAGPVPPPMRPGLRMMSGAGGGQQMPGTGRGASPGKINIGSMNCISFLTKINNNFIIFPLYS